MYPDADKIGKQLKYASTRGAPVRGDRRRRRAARGEVTVKNLQTGEQTPVAPRSDAGRMASALALSAPSDPSGPSPDRPAARRILSYGMTYSALCPEPTPAARCAPSDVGADVVAARLGAPRPRSRRRDVHRHPRSRTASRRSSCANDEPLMAVAKRLRSEFVVGVHAASCERRVRRHRQPEARRPARSRCSRARSGC